MTASASAGYAKLLSEAKPEIIQNDEQNQAYIARLEVLTGKKEVSAAEAKLIALLALLVEEYEDRAYPIPNAHPLAVVRHLMEANNLRQKDLTDVFATESIVSDVLSGKRELTKEHIRRLSDRFHVSPAVFF